MYKNLCGHVIRLQFADGNVVELPGAPKGGDARVYVTDEVVGTLNGMPVVVGDAGPVTGLPDPVPGTIFIVSGMVRTALGPPSVRPDVFAPDTGPSAIRRDGQVWAVTRLRLK